MPSPEIKKQEIIEKGKTFKIDTKDLLSELASKIAREFGIDVSQVKDIIKSQSSVKLESLKGIIQETETSGSIDFARLKTVLNGAKNVIEKMSHDEIELLKGSITETKLSPEDNFYLSSRIISSSTIQSLYNPQGITDNILGAGIGILNSAEATVKLLYDIGAGIIKAPYHIYLIISGKWEYEWMKRI